MKTSTKGSNSQAAKTEKKKKGLSKANSNEVAAQITEKKDLKYIYPADCEIGKSKAEIKEKRKKYRASVRRKLESLKKALKVAKKSDDPKDLRRAEKELVSYSKEHLANAQ
jgi:hypothetical protein